MQKHGLGFRQGTDFIIIINIIIIIIIVTTKKKHKETMAAESSSQHFEDVHVVKKGTAGHQQARG